MLQKVLPPPLLGCLLLYHYPNNNPLYSGPYYLSTQHFQPSLLHWKKVLHRVRGACCTSLSERDLVGPSEAAPAQVMHGIRISC